MHFDHIVILAIKMFSSARSGMGSVTAKHPHPPPDLKLVAARGRCQAAKQVSK